MKRNRNIAALVAACMLIALAIPAVAAADYPQHAQFIAYYDPGALANATEKTTGTAGYTYVNPDAQVSTATKAVSTNLIKATPSTTDWPQFHYNAVHNGTTTSNAIDYTMITSTDYKAIGTINPIIANGYIYLLTGYAGFDEPYSLTSINLTKIKVSDNSVVWNFQMPRNTHYGSWSSPATDGNYVYASSDNKHYAVNVSTGKEVWNFTSFEVNVNGGPSIGGNYVFLSDWGSGSGGNYYNLSKTTGALQWVFNNTKTASRDMQYSQASPAWDSKDGAIYVTGYTYSGASPNGSTSLGYLYKVSPSGNEIWSSQSEEGETFAGSASFNSDTVYVTSYNFNGDGHVYAFNKTDGTRRWINVTERTDATPAIANGLVYVTGGWNGGAYGSAQPGVRAYNTTTGILAWSRIDQGMGGWTDSVSVASGYAYVGKESGDNALYCYNTTYVLNALTGADVFSYGQGGATAAIANNKMYTIGNDGHLYKFG